jgi:hypothetical protein
MYNLNLTSSALASSRGTTFNTNLPQLSLALPFVKGRVEN